MPIIATGAYYLPEEITASVRSTRAIYGPIAEDLRRKVAAEKLPGMRGLYQSQLAYAEAEISRADSLAAQFPELVE